jgi:hypothetical protein
MIATPGQLRYRRLALSARIAAQREQFARELGGLRGPLQVFEVARGFGDVLARHVWLTGVATACAGFLLLRGGMFARARRAVELAGRTARWWMLARVGWRRLRSPA